MKVCIIGLGYVGLPLVKSFLNKGIDVVGIDIDKQKIKDIVEHKSYIKHINFQPLWHAYREGKLKVFSDYTDVDSKDFDAIIVCVPTPITESKLPDTSCLENVARQIHPLLSDDCILISESTTYPGNTEEIFLPILQKFGNIGVNIHLAFSPEREDPGNKDFKLDNTPKVIGGYTEACLSKAVSLYSLICEKVHPVSSIKVAETSKLLENTYRMVNISFINEMKMFCNEADINIWEVINASSTKPFGFKPFYPGPKIGGHCIAVDPYYLSWKACQTGKDLTTIATAGRINDRINNWILYKTENIVRKKLEKNLEDISILFIGITYKPNIDDLRESGALDLMELFTKSGAKVEYHDPFIPTYRKSISQNLSCIDYYDLVLLAVDHSCLNYQQIQTKSKLLIDLRGKCIGENVYQL